MKIGLPDVVGVGVATDERAKPAVLVIPHWRTEYVEEPNERANVEREQDTTDSAKESQWSHPQEAKCRLTTQAQRPGQRDA